LKAPIRIEQNAFAWRARNPGAGRALVGPCNDRSYRREDPKGSAHAAGMAFHGDVFRIHGLANKQQTACLSIHA
jgi:hypothetical protein